MDIDEKALLGMINRSPDITPEAKGLFDDASTLGVNTVKSGPFLDTFGLAGIFDGKNPNQVNIDRLGLLNKFGQEHYKETVAHESEHARQKQGNANMYPNIPDEIKAKIMSYARGLPGGVTVERQPHIEEAMAFLRGKEAVNNQGNYPQDVKSYIQKMMYPGYNKAGTAEESTFTPTMSPRKTVDPVSLENLRRIIRNYTAY